MAGITQTIPNYFGGISEQPDQLKSPGQVKNVVNAIPDLTYGLYKRPGSKRVGTSPLASVQSGGSWFHYYRDETEGSYIGQIAADGNVRVWRCNDGQLMTTAWGSTKGANETNLKAYLSASNTEDIQCLTINDTTFVNNRDTTVGTTGTTDAKPDAHCAYVELLRTENGRQYGLNVYDNDTTSTLNRATRLSIASDTLDEGGGTGHCPGIGTQVFNVTTSVSAKNLIFRITCVGQSGAVGGAEVDDGGAFACAYTRRIELLHGGEGWSTSSANQTVTMTNSKNGGYQFTVSVSDSEVVNIKANIKAVRPVPTPFDADTCVTADSILGGIEDELSGTGITVKVIGNGLYLTRSSAFNVEVVDSDLMRVMQSEVNDVSKLPIQCKHGYIVKVSNAQMSDEDDYYMKFVGENGKDGSGTWVECPAPGIVKSWDPATMPVIIQRTAATTFTVDRYAWDDREVGDDTTNPIPKINGRKINRVLFFRNRLVLLAGENVLTSRPGDFGNFWADTALTVSAIDPVDIAASSAFPSDLFDGIEITTGLLVFSTNQQFLLSADDAIFNPDTAKLRSIATYNYNKVIPPVSMGTTVAFIDNSGKYSRFNEVAGVRREGEPIIVEQSKVVPRLLPKSIDLITTSRENGLVFFGKTGSDEVIGFKYVTMSQQRAQAAWFKWKFNNNLKYHFIQDDQYYYLDEDDFLQTINLIQSDSDPSIDEEGVNYLIHLDNYTTVSGGVYNATTNLTTFTNQATWIPDVTSPNGKLVLVDTDSATARVGRYAECTLTGNSPNDDFTVPGDWSSATVNIGYLFDYQVDFPRLFPTKPTQQGVVSDVNSSLVLHRVKLNFGRIGLYETTLTRVGKDPYTEVYESTTLNNYNVSDAPYLPEEIQTVPVYDKNTNVDITLKSSHPAPATLRSMSWEGDYTPKFYQRA